MSHYNVTVPDTVKVKTVSEPSVVTVFVPGVTPIPAGASEVAKRNITIPLPPFLYWPGAAALPQPPPAPPPVLTVPTIPTPPGSLPPAPPPHEAGPPLPPATKAPPPPPPARQTDAPVIELDVPAPPAPPGLL